MFYQVDESGYEQKAEGVLAKVLVHGEKTLLAHFKLTAGAKVPTHQHPHEQTGYLISGRIRFELEGGESHEVGPGGAWNVAGGAPHAAEALEDSILVEAFHPVREDMLAK